MGHNKRKKEPCSLHGSFFIKNNKKTSRKSWYILLAWFVFLFHILILGTIVQRKGRNEGNMNQKIKKTRKKSKAPFYALIVLLLIVCAWLFRAEKPAATPGQTEDKKIFENAWIVSAKENTLIFMADGILMQVHADGVTEINNKLADIEIKNGRAIKIGIKEDKIRGRVLAVGEDFIEIDGYGKLPLSEKFAAYQIYGELTQKDYQSILVGYDVQEFIVGNGQVCGAIIQEEVEKEKAKIRVLLRGDNYEGDSHERIAVQSTEAIILEYGEEQRRLEPSTEYIFDTTSIELSSGRIRLSTESGEGMITITSLIRAQGNPSYYGSLEITKQEDRLLVVNELELEKYLYFVVPSEMPASYGLEALKAQAVCARSYAWRHILANSLSAQGAHVDDSSGYQVYNNYPSVELTNQAVDETKGQIMMCGEEIVNAYYFSTSCGYTTDADIWSADFTLPYIKGKRVWKEEIETDFATAIMDWEYPAYDKEFPWYRWYVNFSLDALQNCINIAGLGDAVGTVQGLEVSVRGTNGVAKAITITGSKGSVVIEKEYQIRKFLSPNGIELHRRDGEVITNFALLPSGFFLVREILDEGKVTGYRIDGGGFGHGAGMSQNAAKAMAEEGNTYKDILTFFYQGIEVVLYQ